MDLNTDSREQAVTQARNESDKSDLRQHADKMLRAFESFNDFSSNRAVWELVQNACDLTVHCEIIIDYRNGQFAFAHNGKPFTSNSLISLVKQVSGDKDLDSEVPPVGKYGTGFLTSHSLGRKILINGLLKVPDGYTEIKDFIIDRRAKEWEKLIDLIQEQKDGVFEIIRSGTVVENPVFKTMFTYLPETDQEKRYVQNSYKDLEEYIPIVLTISKRLKTVTIISETNTTLSFVLSSKEPVLNNEGITVYKTCIGKNGNEQVVYSLADLENEIEIILPIDKDLNLFAFPNRIARLFLHYPLVGSEDFGMNFIINCNRFLPTEPRNGIHLNSNKDQVKDQEATNRILLDRATDLLFSFLNSKILPVSNSLLYAKINFKRNSDNGLLNEYFTGLQTRWIDRFKNLEIIKTKSGYKKVEDVAFLHPSLIQQSEYFDCIYYVADLFYSEIPEKDIVKDWSSFVYEWQYEKVLFIEDKDLAGKLHAGTLKNLEAGLLIRYYSYLIETNKSLFTDYKLIPNIYGEFEQVNLLKRPQHLDDVLLQIGGEIIPKSMNHLVHGNFVLGFDFEVFDRRHFSSDVNTALNKIVTDKHFCLPQEHNRDDFNEIDRSQFEEFSFQTFTHLLKYCKLSTKKDSKSRPAVLFGLISGYYEIDKELSFIVPVTDGEDELDLRMAQKKLVMIFFNTLLQQKEEWVESEMLLMYDIISCYEDRYKDVYLSSKIYPNQLFKLRLINELKKDIDLTPETIGLYNKVLRTDIRSGLADKRFNEFLIENEKVINKDLTTKIEDEFFSISVSINEHPFKDEILKLIPHLNQESYRILFPRLYDKRASLMLEVVTNENTKDDIFSIVTLNEKRLKQIGQLIQQDNIDAILQQAQEAIRLENEKRSDFAHKYEIGTYIEDHIRLHLSNELASKIKLEKDKVIETEDIQGGQDIMIFYEEKKLYYIEVKSRWNPKTSISMSKLQLEKASTFADRYALLSVDVTKYEGSGDRYKLSIEEIIPLTKVLTRIGSDIEPLIKNNLIAELDQASSIRLIDYRGLVNQETISAGQNFDPFLKWLIGELEARIVSLNQS